MDYAAVVVDQKEILIFDKKTFETVVHLKEDDIVNIVLKKDDVRKDDKVSIVLNYLLKTKPEIKLNIIENTSQEKKQSLKNKLYDLKSIKLFKLFEVEFK